MTITKDDLSFDHFITISSDAISTQYKNLVNGLGVTNADLKGRRMGKTMSAIDLLIVNASRNPNADFLYLIDLPRTVKSIVIPYFKSLLPAGSKIDEHRMFATLPNGAIIWMNASETLGRHFKLVVEDNN